MNGKDEAVRQALRGYAAHMRAGHALPAASLVRLRAERRRRQMARRRAEWPLRVMQGVATLCAAVMCGWCVSRVGSLPPMPAMGTPLLVLAVVTGLLVAGGCGAMLAASRE